MLITCLFSLSAILAPVLIAIYILQHFTLGREPTLMVPNWQDWVVRWWTICCLLRSTARVPVCVHMHARVCVCVSAPAHVPKYSSVPMCVHVCTHESASAVCMCAHMNSIGEVGRTEISAFIPLFLKRKIPDLLWLPPPPQPKPATVASCPLTDPCPEALQPARHQQLCWPWASEGRAFEPKENEELPFCPQVPFLSWVAFLIFMSSNLVQRQEHFTPAYHRDVSTPPVSALPWPCKARGWRAQDCDQSGRALQAESALGLAPSPVPCISTQS